MNQEPRVVLEFKKDRTEYRLVYDGAAYAIQARDTMHSPYIWQPTTFGFQFFCEYVEEKILNG